MEESEKQNLYDTFKAVIESIVNEKRQDPKSNKKLNKLIAGVNLGLQIEEDDYFWLNLKANDGKLVLEREKLEEYEFELLSTPEDLLYFCNGTNSTVHMVTKKNVFGKKKLRIQKGTTGRNLGKVLKLANILVIDKEAPSN
ncbi:MAG: hypothetical protein ACTSQD_04260 [Promethearchaeota archaeon]